MELVSLGAFLRARRAGPHPGDLTVPTGTNQRRVAGLRREEVALAAGISVDYYTRLEQDRAGLVPSQVLDALAVALQLDGSETAYVRDLARQRGNHQPGPTHQYREPVRPQVRRLLEIITTPAILYGRGGDILAWNRPGGRLYVDLDAEEEPNHPRLLFLDPRLRRLLPDHGDEARQTVAHLRAQLGRAPGDERLRALVRELAAGSALFRRLWEQQDVTERLHGTKVFAHPDFGELRLHYEVLHLPGPDQVLFVYSAEEPGCLTEHALARLTDPA